MRDEVDDKTELEHAERKLKNANQQCQQNCVGDVLLTAGGGQWLKSGCR